MNDKSNVSLLPDLHHSADYRIQFIGRLDHIWEKNFGDMQIKARTLGSDPAITEIVAKVPDQAGLHGLLSYIRDMGLPLVKVEYLSK